MKTSSKITRTAGATAIALALFATPVAAVEDDPAADTVEETAEADEAEDEGESDKIQLAETPRDRVGLFLLATLGLMGLAGGITAVRQLGGKRPQTDGEFRWR